MSVIFMKGPENFVTPVLRCFAAPFFQQSNGTGLLTGASLEPGQETAFLHYFEHDYTPELYFPLPL
jgi:hypothetical protein